MKIEKTEGLIAAPFTPMNTDGSVNLNIIRDYARKLQQDKLKGVFICGTTGEGMLLTNSERKAIVEQWVEHQSAGLKVFVHVGTTSSKQSFELAKHAQQAGAYATACMGPMYLKPTHIEELVGFCSEVAKGAPDIPFYYYHFPNFSGVDFNMSEFIPKAAETIPNFAGVKFTHNNFMDMMQCLNLDGGKWDILHGYDEVLLAGLAFGARGAVGSTYNYMAPLYTGMMNDFNNGNLEAARKKQALSIKVVGILNKYGGPMAAGKAIMKSAGVDCGPCRMPVKTVTGKLYENLTEEIEQSGAFELKTKNGNFLE